MGGNRSLEYFETAIIADNNLPYAEVGERRRLKFDEEVEFDAVKGKRLMHFAERQSIINSISSQSIN